MELKRGDAMLLQEGDQALPALVENVMADDTVRVWVLELSQETGSVLIGQREVKVVAEHTDGADLLGPAKEVPATEDPVYAEIARVLRPHVPPNAPPGATFPPSPIEDGGGVSMPAPEQPGMPYPPPPVEEMLVAGGGVARKVQIPEIEDALEGLK